MSEPETRLCHLSALVDDARCVVADINADPPREWELPLALVRRRLNEVIEVVEKLRQGKPA